MTAERITYFWCVPSSGDAARLQVVIDALAEAQGAPRYMPHLSLASISGPVPDLSEVLRNLQALRLQPNEIDESDAFTMSLILRVERHPALLRARHAFETAPGFRSSRSFDPHLSLCYGPPPRGAAQSDGVQDLLKKPLTFDRLVTVDIPASVTTYDDIRAWKILETIPL